MWRAFRSLRNPNYRLWAAGSLVSNVGTWIQRTAQDWLVLAELTRHNATAVGVVMALQYGPHLLLLPLTGFAADRFDRRKLLMTTQLLLGLLAGGLGLMTVAGFTRLSYVYAFAFLLGCVTAFDAPARLTFVTDLVGEEELSNAVALNSTSFNAGRMIGPAVAGILITSVGTGWAFLVNALSFAAVLASLLWLRVDQLHVQIRAERVAGSLSAGLRYVWIKRDLRTVMLMLLFIGTFGLNFPIFISTMAVTVFHTGAGTFGLLSSMMAIGSIMGALLAGAWERPHLGILLSGALLFGISCAAAAVTPNYYLFGAALVFVGLSALSFTTGTNTQVQLATEPVMRGRVMAIRLAIALGGTPLGAPIVGWVADTYGARWALGVGALSGFAAAAVAALHLRRDPIRH
jgi:MFS family permease